MLKKLFIFHCSLFFALSTLSSYGQGQQSSARAQEIVNSMTARIKTFPSVSLNFTLNIIQLQEDTETEQEGRMWLQNNMFKLETPDYVVFFDGTNFFQYMPEFREAYKMPHDPASNNEDFQLLNPMTYFNISPNNFRTFLLRESTQNSRSVYEIDLIPVDVFGTSYSRIHLMVERSTMQLAYLKVFMKDGMHIALTFKPYSIISALSNSFFTFNPAEHPNVELIDLSF